MSGGASVKQSFGRGELYNLWSFCLMPQQIFMLLRNVVYNVLRR